MKKQFSRQNKVDWGRPTPGSVFVRKTGSAKHVHIHTGSTHRLTEYFLNWKRELKNIIHIKRRTRSCNGIPWLQGS